MFGVCVDVDVDDCLGIYNNNNKIMKQDSYILSCCLQNSNNEPYIGVDGCCEKPALMCLQHSPHYTPQGLLHPCLPIPHLKSKLSFLNLTMQTKTSTLISSLNNFLDRLVEHIREIQLRRTTQLRMLWLRDLVKGEDELQAAQRVFRGQFEGVTCRQMEFVYGRVINSDDFLKKSIQQFECYKGLHSSLQKLSSPAAQKLLAEKLTQLQGILQDGQLLKKHIPDSKHLYPSHKEVLLEQSTPALFDIMYNKSKLIEGDGTGFAYFWSKYPLVVGVDYNIQISTKFSTTMVGICSQAVTKQKKPIKDIYYDNRCITYHFGNGNLYRDGMFLCASNHNQSVKGITDLYVKVRLTETELLIVAKKSVLIRCSRTRLGSDVHLICLARTKGDQFQILCDMDSSSAQSIQMLRIIQSGQVQQQLPQLNLQFSQLQLSLDKIAQFSKQSQPTSQTPQKQPPPSINKQSSQKSIPKSPKSPKQQPSHTAQKQGLPNLDQSQQQRHVSSYRTINSQQSLKDVETVREVDSYLEHTTWMNKSGKISEKLKQSHNKQVDISGTITQPHQLPLPFNPKIPKHTPTISFSSISAQPSQPLSFPFSLPSQQLSMPSQQLSLPSPSPSEQQCWQSQKKKYLQTLKSKLSLGNLSQSSKQGGLPIIQTLQISKKSSKNSLLRINSESSGIKGGNSFLVAENSMVQVNLSDQLSMINQNAQVGVLGVQHERDLEGLEKLGQTVFKQQIVPVQKKMKTPPKVTNFHHKFDINDSFQF